ncbi:MAG: site-specific integrase [Clostridiales bacterium]|nr:site-specific integrase [Clostridiales bacterium]
MASIIKRKKKFSVVYTYTDENGNKRQKWETFDTNAEAKKRKAQVEFEQESGTFIVPASKTLNDLLEDYVSIYGVNTWAMSTYESRKNLISNYIKPIIGDMKLDDITPRIMDKYYQDLLKVKAVIPRCGRAKNEYVSVHTVREIHKLLRNAFNQAVKWELISRNLVEHATLPKEEHATRDIWTAEILFKAIELCDDDILKLALNLAFSCSLRMGEMLGLTWDCVDISPVSIETGNASIFINKELQRVNKDALENLDEKDVIFKFPAVLVRNSTALVLKTPKTRTSVRKIFLPRTVAEMLVARKAEIEELKELFGDEYYDYNMVFANPNGRPMESQVITRSFQKLIKDNDLPKVVFHSLRHSSITYKLKLNGGDVKAVQGDSGHAQVKMVTDVYSHIIDEDRRKNAQRFEEAFYSGGKAAETQEPAEPAPAPAADPAPAPAEEMSSQEMLAKLLADPNMAAILKQLAQTL